MSAHRSVCIRCGTLKRFVSETCPACGFEPKSQEDIAKSYLLSTEFDAGNDVFGKPNEELLTISEQLRQGQYQFDADDVRRHLDGYRQFQRITPKTLLVDLVKWIGGPVLILAAMLALIFLNR